MMDVLLIQPRNTRPKRVQGEQFGVMPPMMLYYLATPLMEMGLNVDILDLTVYRINDRRFQDYVRTFAPTIVGITTPTENYSQAIKTAELIKDARPESVVVLGGPHVTFVPENTLTADAVDFVVLGEGEMAFTSLVTRLLDKNDGWQDIPGIAFRQNGGIRINPRKLIKDLDSLSFPARDTVNTARYLIPGVILTSRGCPFKCHFCTAAAMAGGRYRMRDVENIKREIDYLVVGLGITYLAFTDDTVTGFPKRVRQICQHILNRGYRIAWLCESRVDVADRELLWLMAQSGCHSIQFGFESGNEAILKSINKHTTPEQMVNAVRLCMECGILPSGNFMIGFPDDTRETIADTLKMAKTLKRLGAHCDIAVLTPFPGTYYYDNRDKLGITIHSDNWDDFALENPIISTPNFSLEELKGIYVDARSSLSVGI